MQESEAHPLILTPCSSGRRLSNGSINSPEFEFWNLVRNPSTFPQSNLHSADELFSGGVLLPLHLLTAAQEPEQSGSVQASEPEPEAEAAELSSGTDSTLNSSKRWRDIIFKKNDKKTSQSSINGKDCSCVIKEKKREKKNGVVSSSNNGVSAAELNINIWPFSRSRSAGNGGARPRAAAAGNRKVSSAPCSRSNSGGESKSRKWPSSPGRAAGVHLGRNSPVWQIRRSAGAGGGEKGVKKDGNEGRRKVPVVASGNRGSNKARVLSLNVPMCIGYRPHLSCKNDENSAASTGGGDGGGGDAGEGIRGNNIFNIRSLFTKKVY